MKCVAAFYACIMSAIRHHSYAQDVFGIVPQDFGEDADAIRNEIENVLANSDDEEMKVLGMRALGEHASSAIQAVALLISMDKGIGELAELIHPHPSIIEGIQECIRILYDKSIYKPSIFQDFLEFKHFRNGSYQ